MMLLMRSERLFLNIRMRLISCLWILKKVFKDLLGSICNSAMDGKSRMA